MPRLTYHPKHPDDPETTSTHGVSFEKGKSVDVAQATYDALKDNPWFKGGSGAQDTADNALAGGGEPSTLPSGINVAYPPGSGDKYPGAEFVKTSDGMVPAEEASDEDGANVPFADEAPKRRGRPPKAD